MGTSLMVSIVALGVSTYAWFATAFMDRVLISSGDLTVESAKFEFYKWAFTKTNGYIIPSTLLSGDGAFEKGTETYTASAAAPGKEGEQDAFTMNTFDPYLSEIYGEGIDQRTALYAKVTIKVKTSCDFDLSLDGILDSTYTLTDTKGGLLSKYAKFKILEGDAFDPTSFATDQALYSGFVAAFKTNYTGTTSSFTTGVSDLALASKTSLMGGDVAGTVETSVSYWLAVDYDTAKLKDDYGGVDFYASSVTLYQDYYFAVKGTQRGI